MASQKITMYKLSTRGLAICIYIFTASLCQAENQNPRDNFFDSADNSVNKFTTPTIKREPFTIGLIVDGTNEKKVFTILKTLATLKARYQVKLERVIITSAIKDSHIYESVMQKRTSRSLSRPKSFPEMLYAVESGVVNPYPSHDEIQSFQLRLKQNISPRFKRRTKHLNNQALEKALLDLIPKKDLQGLEFVKNLTPSERTALNKAIEIKNRQARLYYTKLLNEKYSLSNFDLEVATVGSVTKLFKQLNISHPPVWLIQFVDQTHIIEGESYPEVTINNILESYRRKKPVNTGTPIFYHRSPSGRRFKQFNQNDKLSVSLTERNMTNPEPLIDAPKKDAFLSQLPECSHDKIIRYQVFQNSPYTDGLDYIFYSGEQISELPTSVTLVPYRSSQSYNPEENYSLGLSALAEGLGVECLPTRVHFIIEGNSRYLELRIGNKAWNQNSNLKADRLKRIPERGTAFKEF